MTPPRLGLALGGGGSRALCHLGVLGVLEAADLRPGAVAGSSLGALLAAMYAFEPDAAAVQERALSYFRGSRLFGLAARQPRDHSVAQTPSLKDRLLKGTFLGRLFLTLLVRPSLLRENPVRRAAADLLPDADIRDAALPLACTALDMVRGEVAAFTEGKVREAVTASASVATILPLHRWDGGVYADAAPVSSVPVHAARALGAARVLAVDLRSPVPEQRAFANGFEVFRRLEATSSRLLNDAEVRSAEAVLRLSVEDIFWGDFGDVETPVERGRRAAEEALPRLRQSLAPGTGGA
jgi:NTE family protein